MRIVPLRQAGSALTWKAIQLGGVKAIFMLRLLVLAWLLTPEDFGLLAIAVTAIGFFMSITDVGMIPALVQGEAVDEEQYNAAWTVGLTRAVFITVIVCLAAPVIAQIFAEPRATNIIRVLALRPLLEATASIKVAALTRNLQFRPLAIIRLSEAVVNTVVSIVLAPIVGVWALVAGVLIGATSYLLLSYLLAFHRPSLSFKRDAIRPLIQFGRWVFITSLVVMVGGYVLRVVISRQLGTAELGLYFLAAQLAYFPAEVASEVVGAVAFPLFARLQFDLVLVTRTFRTTLLGMATLLFPVCALLIVLAPTLVQEILGPRWQGTAPVIQVLAVVSMIGVFGEVTVPVFQGLGQPYRVTIIEIVQSVSIISLVWGLTLQFGLVGAALAWLPTIIISQIVSALFIHQMLLRPFTGLGLPMIMIVIATIIGAVVAVSLNTILPGLAGLIMAGLAAFIVVGGLLWVADHYLRLGMVQDLGRIFPRLATLTGYAPADQ